MTSYMHSIQRIILTCTFYEILDQIDHKAQLDLSDLEIDLTFKLT